MDSSDFSKGKMWGFQLARRVSKGKKWHPGNDNLRGLASYGTSPTDPTNGPTGTIQWDFYKVKYFMFSTGDFTKWYPWCLNLSALIGARTVMFENHIRILPDRHLYSHLG